MVFSLPLSILGSSCTPEDKVFLSLQYLWEEHLLTAGDQGDHTLLPHSRGIHLQASLNQLCPGETVETENRGHTGSIRPGFLQWRQPPFPPSSPKKCGILHKNLLPVSAMLCPNSTKPIAVLTMAPQPFSRMSPPFESRKLVGTTPPFASFGRLLWFGAYCD